MIALPPLNEWPHVSRALLIACAPGCRRREPDDENPAPSPEMDGLLGRVPQARHVPCTSAFSHFPSAERRWQWAGAGGDLCEQKGAAFGHTGAPRSLHSTRPRLAPSSVCCL